MYILVLSMGIRINNVELYTENSIYPDEGSHRNFIASDTALSVVMRYTTLRVQDTRTT